ncbi:MAG: DUF4421 family protein [Flavobacteriales bacterium]|nr:DUF4421 family protein [Flavobacteriales bacterium]MCB9363593.1 DUF4421 family protein [Flavobacteriales bacterium]
MMRSLYYFLIFFFLFITSLVYGQLNVSVSPDSSRVNEYYTDYPNELLLKFGLTVKANKLQIVNTNSNETAKFSPAATTSLGGGVNYKWFGLALAYGLPSTTANDVKYGKTSRFDAQFNIYTKSFGVDVIFQNYQGFYLQNPSIFTTWEKNEFPQLPAMQSASLGVGGYYFFNHKKFSYKAAYVRNTVQQKSAGSFLIGGYYSLDYAGFEDGSYDRDTITSFIPKELPQEAIDSFDIKTFTSSSFGFSLGYTYTVVFFKKCFINASLAPGFGAKNLRVYNSEGENETKAGVVSRLTLRLALGYEGKHFLLGFTSYLRTADISYNQYDIKPSTSNVKFFIAKRFKLKKSKE